MKVIAGLGNPGVVYANSRHNAGILFVDYLSQKLESDYGWRSHKEAMVFESKDLVLAKTKDRFMNESGIWVRELLKNTPDHELILVHDDLDIKLGDFKMQTGIGPKIHYGIQSVESALGTKDFARIRIGVDNRDPNNREAGDQYVLQKFSLQELQVLEGVLDEITQAINR